MFRHFVDFLLRSVNNALGLVAIIIVTISAFALIGLLGVELTNGGLSPYVGILTYMVLPAGFVLGLLLLAFAHWRIRRALSRGEPIPWQLDLADPSHRARLGFIGILTVLNLIILGLTGYHGVHYMDSSEFCGEVCHAVMEPEFKAYQNSPHARVECTECHIGPGASWYVKSKLSGTRQVFATLFNTYPRPVPTPIENLRPARETCQQCHWPAKFHGDRIKVLSRFQEDEANTELKTILNLKVGGGSIESGFAEGIHWHMNLANRIEYRADEERLEFYWIRVEDMNGAVREYWHEDDLDRETIAQIPVRVMDCLDCHNRPTHEYDLPGHALDEALQSAHVNDDLPYLKREGMRLLQASYNSKEEALEGFEDALRAFYSREYPEIAAQHGDDIVVAAEALRAIYDRNIFPDMNIDWGTYPNHIGHTNDLGCFRCHDEEHVTDAGETISQDCSNCHALLAYEEEDPEILSTLLGQ